MGEDDFVFRLVRVAVYGAALQNVPNPAYHTLISVLVTDGIFGRRREPVFVVCKSDEYRAWKRTSVTSSHAQC